MNSRIKRYLFLICLVALLITTISISKALGVFETVGEGTANLPISNWKVKVNGTEVEDSMIIKLSDFEFVNDKHIREGKFGPGSTGNYTIEIDNSENDVAIEYEITYDKNQLTEHPNITFKVSDSELTSIETEDYIKFTGTLDYKTNNKKTFEVSLVWNNDETYNEADNEFIENYLHLVLNMDFKQHVE